VVNVDGIKFMIKDLVYAEFLANKIEFTILPPEDVNAYLIYSKIKEDNVLLVHSIQSTIQSLKHVFAILASLKILDYASVLVIIMNNLSMEIVFVKLDII